MSRKKIIKTKIIIIAIISVFVFNISSYAKDTNTNTITQEQNETQIMNENNEISEEDMAVLSEVLSGFRDGKIKFGTGSDQIQVKKNTENSDINGFALFLSSLSGLITVFFRMLKNSQSLLIAILLMPLYLYLKQKNSCSHDSDNQELESKSDNNTSENSFFKR